MTIKPIQSIAALALVALLLALAGCADKTNPNNVDRRSVERWNYLIAHQAEKAYDYLSPGYQVTRTRDSYAAAMNNRPVQWTGVTFNHKECDAERCKVAVDVSYQVKLPGTGTLTKASSTQNETWILVKGDWYYLPSD